MLWPAPWRALAGALILLCLALPASPALADDLLGPPSVETDEPAAPSDDPPAGDDLLGPPGGDLTGPPSVEQETAPADDLTGPPAAQPEAPGPAGEPFLDIPALVDEIPLLIGGFLDVRAGTRTQEDPYQMDASLLETRLQLDFEYDAGGDWGVVFRAKTDLLYDPIPDRDALDLEEGRGWLDLREANVLLSPTDWMDLKAGRQVLTWGTGDMLFLNDMFPKDWNSYFIGRDVEYLKAPSDALKASVYTDLLNVDVVFTPRFDADRFIDGDRLSYWNTMQRRRSGTFVREDKRDDCWHESETAWRFSRSLGTYEVAVYGYYGYWKSPEGFNVATGLATHPPLSTYGFSVRGPLGPGIANVEFAGYDSRSDRDGSNPFVPNSELRYLVGYTQEVARDLTAGVQYYVEHMMDYGSYRRARLPGTPLEDLSRHVLTLRLTQLLMNQNLTLSMFAYYSPSDDDAYLRPYASYKLSDAWTLDAGANVFFGSRPERFFAQFSKNSNIYVGLRYSF